MILLFIWSLLTVLVTKSDLIAPYELNLFHQVRAAVRHDVQRGAVHGDDVQPGLQRQAARRHRLPRLGVAIRRDFIMSYFRLNLPWN